MSTTFARRARLISMAHQNTYPVLTCIICRLPSCRRPTGVSGQAALVFNIQQSGYWFSNNMESIFNFQARLGAGKPNNSLVIRAGLRTPLLWPVYAVFKAPERGPFDGLYMWLYVLVFTSSAINWLLMSHNVSTV